MYTLGGLNLIFTRSYNCICNFTRTLHSNTVLQMQCKPRLQLTKCYLRLEWCHCRHYSRLMRANTFFCELLSNVTLLCALRRTIFNSFFIVMYTAVVFTLTFWVTFVEFIWNICSSFGFTKIRTANYFVTAVTFPCFLVPIVFVHQLRNSKSSIVERTAIGNTLSLSRTWKQSVVRVIIICYIGNSNDNHDNANNVLSVFE